MLNILITGGCGFIGSNFINYMVPKYPSINFYNIDKLDYCASISNVLVSNFPNYKFFKCDINDRNFVDFILNTFNIDSIIHFAAQSHVDTSFDNSIQYTIDNVMGTHSLLDAAKRFGKLSRFIHISTDEVYGEVSPEHPGCGEHSILNPTNPYAATKAAAEMLVNSYFFSYKLPIIITRGNNVFGPNQYPEKLIPKFIQLLKQNKPMTIHGNGLTRRNFIHTSDVSTAIETILFNGIIGQIYNIGSKNEFSVIDIAHTLHSILKPDIPFELCIQFVDDRPFNDFRYAIDTSKLENLEWSEKTDFIQAITNLCLS
jgi:dTDP-glucose 4,6-dehydratase